jgi:hypothetical protein
MRTEASLEFRQSWLVFAQNNWLPAAARASNGDARVWLFQKDASRMSPEDSGSFAR